jgi:hypothetical protein
MTIKRSSMLAIARLRQMYKTGDKVRVLRGEYAGKIMTVRECTSDEIHLIECPKRSAMSKGNVEPADGFTKEQMAAAEREVR